jgi:hypothetical protein
MLSSKTALLLIQTMTNTPEGNETVSAINSGSAISTASGFSMPTVIVAAHTSTTTDFAALKVGDYVAHIPATAGSADFTTVVTKGTLPEAAVVGDLYIVIRAYKAPALTNYKL